MKKEETLLNKMSVEDVKKCIEAQLPKLINYSDYSGEHSWDYCYSAFQNAFRMPACAADKMYLALHLGFYLASWGMYRGSAFIVDYDYRIHVGTVNLLLDEKYNVLHSISPEQLSVNENINLMMELRDEIRKHYKSIYRHVDDEKENIASDTLVTKILMGTLGCTVAYDVNVKAALNNYYIPQTFNNKSVKMLAESCAGSAAMLKEIGDKMIIPNTGITYPPMRLLDVYLWHEGDNIQKNQSKNKQQE